MRSVHARPRPATFPPPTPLPGLKEPPPTAPPSRLFTRFYKDHRAFVERVLLRSGVAARDVPDVAQEVFVVAWRRWDRLDLDDARAWLFVVATYRAGSYRQLARHRVECYGEEMFSSLVSGFAFDPESIDAHRRLGRLLRRLRPKAREVFVRHALRGQSIQEIASAVAAKPKAVYARLDAARTELGRLVR
jgi:RNA polymerase sigma-70 factor, ECF subfamily